MNDRFNFRAWNKDTKTMHEVEGVYPYKDEYTQGGEVFLEGFKTSYYFPEQVELMQCTGLKDKNGKLIYEGDIVSFKIGSIPTKAVVSWSDECAEWIKGPQASLGSYQKTTQVIGNIYENKELLNG